MNGPAFGRLFALHAHIFKITAVPDRSEIALQSGFVVNVAFTRVNPGFNCFGWDSPITTDVNMLNDLASLRRSQGPWNQSKNQQTKDQPQGPDPRDMLRTGFLNYRRSYMTTLRATWEKPDYTGVIAEVPLGHVPHPEISQARLNEGRRSRSGRPPTGRSTPRTWNAGL